MSTSTAGLFADAAAAELPPDDAHKGPLLDLGAGADDAAAKAKAESDATAKAAGDAAAKAQADAEAKAKTDAAAKAGTAEDLTNPNLTGEQKPAEKAKPEDEDVKPAGMTDKAFVSWKAKNAEVKASRAETEQAKTELATLRTQLEEAKKAAPELDSLKKQLEETKLRLEEYEGEISITRIEGTKQFKTAVSAPQGQITTEMTELAKRYEVEPETLLRAIQEPDAGKRADLLEAVTSDFKGVDKLDVVQAAKDWQRTQREAAAMRQDAGKRLEEITRESAAEEEKKATLNTQDYRTAATERWNAYQQKIPYIRKSEGNEKWNTHLESKLRKVESVNVNQLPVDDVADAMVAREILPEVESVARHFETQSKANLERAVKAEKQLAEYIKTAPGAAGGTNNGDRATTKTAGGLFADAVLTPA